uniref:Putative secreted protein n=1 Tax=Anopheles triannulatus TaxID=58253 RepID=A0A2M4B6B6_9DIPT
MFATSFIYIFLARLSAHCISTLQPVIQNSSGAVALNTHPGLFVDSGEKDKKEKNKKCAQLSTLIQI